MPANLTPDYFEAEKRYRAAETPEEKLEALNEMLRVMPKHKGTDGLRAELRTKIAKFQKEAAKHTATARRGGQFHVPKEGAGQITLVGFTNVGKSQLVCSVTKATPEVGDYPYTTKVPHVGMMKFENVQIQLVDMPPLNDQDARPWFATVLRGTDAIILMVDLEIDPVTEVNEVAAELAKYRVGLDGMHALSDEVVHQKPGFIVGTKVDLDPSGENAAALVAAYGSEVPVLCISANSTGLANLGRAAFDVLDILRVYTKSPGREADLSDPMVLRIGSTIEEAAEAVHKDFRRNLRHALIWGSGKFPGQRVSREHVVHDGDILELHA